MFFFAKDFVLYTNNVFFCTNFALLACVQTVRCHIYQTKELAMQTSTNEVVVPHSTPPSCVGSDAERHELGAKLWECICAKDLDGVRDVLMRGIDPNARMIKMSRESALWLAIRHCDFKTTGDLAIVKLLLQAGADPNYRSKMFNDVLLVNGICASQHRNPDLVPEIVTLLLDHKADVNAAEGNSGCTAAHVCAMSREPKVKNMCALLMERKADVTGIRDMWGRTVLDVMKTDTHVVQPKHSDSQEWLIITPTLVPGIIKLDW
jgi:hypothetical protein